MNKNLKKIVKKDGGLFFWGIRLLPKPKREAMYTLYAFFRHFDSIVDGNMNGYEKIELINAWREELENIYEKKVPETDIGRRIYKNCMRFKLPKQEFIKLLDSLSMDIPDPLQAPSMRDFIAYCRGVSGTPCNLSLRVLGCEDEELLEALSTELGNAIKITSILRDIKEDAQAGHMYIPKEILEEAEIFVTDPMKVVIDKNLYIARQSLADINKIIFSNVYTLIEKLDKKTARSIRGLTNLYKRYFDIMDKRGWEVISPKPKVSGMSRLSLVIKSLAGKKV